MEVHLWSLPERWRLVIPAKATVTYPTAVVVDEPNWRVRILSAGESDWCAACEGLGGVTEEFAADLVDAEERAREQLEAM